VTTPSSWRRHRIGTLGAAAAGLILVLGTLAATIVRSENESRSHLAQNFKLRAASSATLVGTYLSQQAQREEQSAEQLLSTPLVNTHEFEAVVAAFGSRAAVVLDAGGRVLGVVPREPKLIGTKIAGDYAHLRAAEKGRVAISAAVPSAVTHQSVTAIAVPFESAVAGRRVFSAAYSTGGPELQAFVDHAVAYPEHEVALVDGQGRLLADSPRSKASTLAEADPALASAVRSGTFGAVRGARTPSTFARAPVPGTPWQIVLMVPDSKLYASIGGLAEVVPWLIFGLVTLLGGLLLLLFARSLADRSRLSALSAELESIARTDPLTGLSNRRGIEEDLAREFARARRRAQPLTVLMVDLDRFKEVNDRYGHEAGDRVLVALADCMRAALRAEDVYGRVGGDEFVAVLDAGEVAGRAAAARLEACAAQAELADIGLGEGIPLSIGIASGVHTSPEDLMRAADAELYRVKGARRAAAAAAPAASGR
jgi:diguanylate cyclase (GGDEF)-like protein